MRSKDKINYDSNLGLKATKSGEMKILLVDDDKGDRLYLSELLEESFGDRVNLQLNSATNFEEAMQTISEDEYDLVILDFKLGYLNGLDVQESIRNERPNLPVVFVTGQGDERVAASAFKQGAMDYLVKDELDVEMINKVLEKVFNRHGRAIIEKTRQLFVQKKPQESAQDKLLMQLDESFKLRPKFKGKFLTNSKVLAVLSFLNKKFSL